jgi:hypothetical protein
MFRYLGWALRESQIGIKYAPCPYGTRVRKEEDHWKVSGITFWRE